MAEQEFNRVVEELKELGIVSNLDTTILAIYADAYANYVKITEQLKNEPLTIEYTNKAGATNIIENPLVKTQMKYIDVIMKCSTKLGLSVSDRLKLVVPKQEEKVDEFAEEFGDI
ncbi:phage terminase small subunit P27 family [Caminicella sporogenes]|uniref:phage terminase small subunit P27 family n=1 Tax=Caminicella sporogenes TaxID=166485 RepID=UPI0025409587|nr:phage terminase small subunit P27 family [Caminicella sporogenes]WIF94308.1 phage terminase small subunit P27 family [Caminicella sporogenes]